MSDRRINPLYVIEPPHICETSWWADAPREGFTALAEKRQFKELDAERRARRRADARSLDAAIESAA